MWDNLQGCGGLNSDKFLCAMLAYRNTQDQDTRRSPAEVLYGRNLREFLPQNISKLQPCDAWRLLREDREKALAKRATRNTERLKEHTRQLVRLMPGDNVRVQNLAGPYPNRLDHTGVVLEDMEFDKFCIKLDGSGRLVNRNRKFLRRIVPYGKLFDVKQKEDKNVWQERTDHRRRDDAAVIPRGDKPVPDGGALLLQGGPVQQADWQGHDDRPVQRAEGPGHQSVQQHTGGGQEVRRSARQKKAPNRLEIRQGVKSYDAQDSQSVIKISFGF